MACAHLFRCFAALAMLVLLAGLRPAAGAAVDSRDPRVLAAERQIRLEIELGAARIQREISARINTVMTTQPPTSFRLRNAVRAGTNSINAATRAEIQWLAGLVREAVDDLIAGGAGVVDASRLADAFDTEVADQLNALALRGVRDLAGLLGSNGRRIPSVRGTAVGTYELLVSKPEDGRTPVLIGRVDLGDSQMVRGTISTAAAAEFFLAPLLPAPVPPIALPPTTVLRAVRWLNRGGAMAITADSSRAETFVAIDQDRFSVTGVDLLPERLRIVLERLLADTPDVRSNIDGAEGFFRSVTYTFRRIPDDGRP